MKVLIKQCSVHPSYWYNSIVGMEYEVVSEKDNTYRINYPIGIDGKGGNSFFYVLKDDCQVLPERPLTKSEWIDMLNKREAEDTKQVETDNNKEVLNPVETANLANAWLREKLQQLFHAEREAWEMTDAEVISITRHFGLNTLADDFENDIKK